MRDLIIAALNVGMFAVFIGALIFFGCNAARRAVDSSDVGRGWGDDLGDQWWDDEEGGR